MKKTALCLALGSLLALGGSAIAEIGTIDDVPASTLLLPYFEVDLDSDQGVTTLFSVNNASASAAVAHVTLWTDESIPTLDFDIYLTGYDVQTLNIRDIFNGTLPRTADDGVDPADTISPQGSESQDINFPGSSGPCANPYPATGALSQSLIDHIRRSHTGQASAIYGNRCLAARYGDNIARGYITVDSVTQCNLSFPSDAGYFTTGIADNRNILWGDYFYVNPGENFASGETLVHIESCSSPSVGNGAGNCPFVTGDYTFYGRYALVAGQDQREPLASNFATRYINGGQFDGGTDLIVWRDSTTLPTGANGTHSCSGAVSWFPLNQADVVAFDEQENPEDLCFQGDNVSPPTGGANTCFPLEAQRIHLAGGNVIGDDPTPPFEFGWMFLNLNTTVAGGAYPGLTAAWVSTDMRAEGRFEVGFDAIKLDSMTTNLLGGLVLLP